MCRHQMEAQVSLDRAKHRGANKVGDGAELVAVTTVDLVIEPRLTRLRHGRPIDAPNCSLPPRSVLPEIMLTSSFDHGGAKLIGQCQLAAELLGLPARITQVLFEQHFVLEAKRGVVILGFFKGSAIFTRDDHAARGASGGLDEAPPRPEQRLGRALPTWATYKRDRKLEAAREARAARRAATYQEAA